LSIEKTIWKLPGRSIYNFIIIGSALFHECYLGEFTDNDIRVRGALVSKSIHVLNKVIDEFGSHKCAHYERTIHIASHWHTYR